MHPTGKKIVPLKFDYWIGASRTGNKYSQSLLPLVELQYDRTRDLNLSRHVGSKCCPYCDNDLKRIKENKTNDFSKTTVWYEICTDCGFWRHHLVDGIFSDSFVFPAIKRFKDEDATPSISYLSSEISKNKQLLYQMNPTRFERFVGSVLSNFYDCEVHHVGQSGDDGIDLLAIVSDEPTMIQVKRRESKNAIEGVNTVKLLFASAFARRANKGMVVTTAKAFSRPSREWIQRPRLKDINFEIRLKNAFDLMIMVDAVANRNTEPWTSFENFFSPNRSKPKLNWQHVRLVDADVLVTNEVTAPALVFEHIGLDEYTAFAPANASTIVNFEGRPAGDLKQFLSAASAQRSVPRQTFFVREEWGISFETMMLLENRWLELFPSQLLKIEP